MENSLAARVTALQRKVDQETGEARAIAQQGIRAQERAQQLEAEAELHEQACILLTSVGEDQQTYAQRQIEELVTRGLQTIFDETLTFHLVQSVRANQAQLDFVVRSSYEAHEDDLPDSLKGSEVPATIETSVMDARGGGLAAVVGFLLRLVILLLTPGAQRLLVLDETFGHVSAEYEGRLAEFIREVCDKAGVQVLLVTHSRAYDDVADARYRLTLGRGGITEVAKL